MPLALKRTIVALAAVLGAFLLAATAATGLINRDAVRDTVIRQIRDASGLDLVAAGPTRISIFPAGIASFEGVTLQAGASQPAITIARLVARLQLLPLLLQRIEVASVELHHPRIHVTHDSAGSNWAPIVTALRDALQPVPKNRFPISDIRIVNGELDYEDGIHDVRAHLTAIDASLAWPSISRSLGATGEFTWRDQRFECSLGLSDFFATLAGQRAPLKLRLAGKPLRLSFDGTLSQQPALAMDGTLTADTESLRDALRWSGYRPPAGGGFGPLALKARATMADGRLTLADSVVQLDGNVADGVLTYFSNGRRMVQGTLAAETLDLTPYLGALRLFAGNRAEWNREAFHLAPLAAYDVDLRLSAARVILGQVGLGRTAVATNLHGGVATLAIGEAQAFGGTLKGSIGITGKDRTAAMTAQLHLIDINTETATQELLGNSHLSGVATASIVLEGDGTSVYGIAQSLNGTISVIARDGALNGINAEQLLRRLERRPLSGASDFRNGRTLYDTLSFRTHIDNGLATVDTLKLESPSLRVVLNGTASVPTRELDLKGTASLLSTTSASPTFELPFIMSGPWNDALVLPDPESLIRRSPASAPLLDAVRERRARDAVRETLDKLRSAVQSPPAAGEPVAPMVTPPADTPAGSSSSPQN